jgi:hypothetical protein
MGLGLTLKCSKNSKVKAVFLKRDRDQDHKPFFGFFILLKLSKKVFLD